MTTKKTCDMTDASWLPKEEYDAYMNDPKNFAEEEDDIDSDDDMTPEQTNAWLLSGGW